MAQSRQLAAIMFTDIVGYTALMGKDSQKALELVQISKVIQIPWWKSTIENLEKLIKIIKELLIIFHWLICLKIRRNKVLFGWKEQLIWVGYSMIFQRMHSLNPSMTTLASRNWLADRK